MRNLVTIIILCYLIFVPAVGISHGSAQGAKGESTPISAQEHNGLFFSAMDPKIIEWPYIHTDEIPQDTPNITSLFAVTFVLENRSENKKYDVSNNFQFDLRDEFNNAYRTLNQPPDYHKPTFLPNKNYPSLYPGEKISQVAFFETPVQRSKVLFLDIDYPGFGLNHPVTLPLATDTIENFIGLQEKRPPKDDDIYIISPREGCKIKPGEIIYFKFDLSDEIDAPDKVYILSSHYVLEDNELNYKYNVRVPHDQKPGAYHLAVMAEWNKKGERTFISKARTLEVVDPQEECIEDCLNTAGEKNSGDFSAPSRIDCIPQVKQIIAQ